MKIDRLLGIITCLMQNGRMTAPELARRFEVSQRTILRDIEAISMAGIPVISAPGGGGGIWIMEGYRLEHSLLSREELQNILIGLEGLHSISSDPKPLSLLQPGADMVTEDRHIVIDLSSHYKKSLSEKIALIRLSLEEKRLLRFSYYYEKGSSLRTVEPMQIQFRWADWYLFGFCRDRMDFRMFKLNRLWELGLLDEKFSPRPFSKEQALSDPNENEPYMVELLFNPSVRYRLIEEYGPACYSERPGGLYMERSYLNRSHIISWVLSFGSAVKVLGPRDFIKEIRDEASKILSQ